MARRQRSQPVLSLFSFQDIITSVTGIMILVTLFLAVEFILRNETTAASTEQLISQMEGSIEEAVLIEQQIDEQHKQIEYLRERIAAGQQRIESAVPYDADDLRAQIENAREELVERTLEVAQLSGQRHARESELAALQRQAESAKADKKLLQKMQDENNTLEQSLQNVDRNLVLFRGAADEPKKPLVIELAGTDMWAHSPDTDEPAAQFNSLDKLIAHTSAHNPANEYIVIVLKPSGITSYSTLYDTVHKHGFEVSYQLIGEAQTSIPPSKRVGNP